MSKKSGQKLKLMYLSKIFMEHTDENHRLTISEIIAMLEEYGVGAERKSLYDDIESLRSFGMDIILNKGGKTSYYLGSRDFELAELKLLVDAIQSSRFITPKKSAVLIEKLGRLAGPHQSKVLRRNVYISGDTKSHNEGVYYNIDTLHTSISGNRQISFLYYGWTIDFRYGDKIKRMYRRGGDRYIVSPWALIWDSEYYYLVAFDSLHSEIRHYRVDKMSDIQLTDLPREGLREYEDVNILAYSKRVFSMFAGLDETVKVRFANRLIGVVVDRYGHDVFVSPHSEGFFCATIKIALSEQFYAWMFSFGCDAEILAPGHVVEKMRNQAEEIAQMYRCQPRL